MVSIRRTFDPKEINAILNHPDILSWMEGDGGAIDISERLKRPDILIALVGEHGAFTAYRLMSGVYEFHTAILPDGRGRWARQFADAGMLWMFSQTDAMELLTRVPEGHRGARAMACLMGLRQTFPDDQKSLYRGEKVRSLIYCISVQEWAATAPRLEDIGRKLHIKIDEIGSAKGIHGTIWPESHEDSPIHNRHVGAAYICAMGGHLPKGVFLYNRWLLASHIDAGLQARVISCDPAKIWLYHAEISLYPSGDIDISPETGSCLKQQPV